MPAGAFSQGGCAEALAVMLPAAEAPSRPCKAIPADASATARAAAVPGGSFWQSRGPGVAMA